MENPQTDIVLTVRNAKEYVIKCLTTLYQTTKNFRLILVDDQSEEDTASLLRAHLKLDPLALLVTTGKRKWFTRASNIGLRLVRTQRVVLLNSDCEMGDGWLPELYSVWEEAERELAKPMGLVGSELSGDEQRRWQEMKEPGYVTGHCLLLAMSVVDYVAAKRGMPGWYLDELNQGAIHINSDRFLSYEMNRLGFGTVRSFKSAVGHHGGKSWGYDLATVSQLRILSQETGDVG